MYFAPIDWARVAGPVLLSFGMAVGMVVFGAGCRQEAMPVDAEAPTRSGVPRSYVCYRTPSPLAVDGRLDEAAWEATPWTTDFVDIEGATAPVPRFRTRAKMLWDDERFYVAARLEEPDLWATLTQRDTVVYYDNDFEIFIDPDGDTHRYYEVEVNALETVWDLMLATPYRDGGPALDAWDVRGMEVGVHRAGTLNDPSDTDTAWTIEMSLPWRILEEAAPHNGPPHDGERWRVNVSRVQWQHAVQNGRYTKNTDPETGEPLPEDNWVWSPQGAIDMHRPEHWGVVQFTATPVGGSTVTFTPNPNAARRRALRTLYHRQRAHREANGSYAATLAALDATRIAVDGTALTPTLDATPTMYEITLPGVDGTTLHVRQDGKLWATGE